MRCLVLLAFVLVVTAASRDLGYKRVFKHAVRVNPSSDGKIFKDKLRTEALGYVYLDKDGAYTISTKLANATWVAKGNFTQRMNETGWAFLEVQTNPKFPDANQSYAAGLIEGYLTRDMLHYYYVNMMKGFCDGREKTCDNIFLYFTDNLHWMEQLIHRKIKDPYWHQINLVLQQIHGMVDGYNRTLDEDPTLPHLSFSDFWWINSGGDLEELTKALSESDEIRTTPELFFPNYRGVGRCSALIKVLPNNTDLYTSQVTWNEYASMTRILKKYIFPFMSYEKPSSGIIPGHSQTFSSYPGMIMSGDDFTIISSGLVTLETTIGNGNAALWKYIKPKTSVLEWIRSIIANRLAETGEEWAVIFRQFNSGTYNNQWMVVDYGHFKPGGSLPDGLLWVIEQLPGHSEARDKTEVLRSQAYWPSYNTPYFPKIFNLSGSLAMVEKYGDWFSYDRTPRALIFKRDHGKVTDLKSMMKLMRYNDFVHDPLSACNCTPPFSAENAISARNDLNIATGKYPFPSLSHRSHGGTDAKITSASLAAQLQFVAAGGPTFDDLPPFQWSKTDFNVSRVGHPDVWKFDPIVTDWNWDLQMNFKHGRVKKHWLRRYRARL